jgi:hypothetical protein
VHVVHGADEEFKGEAGEGAVDEGLRRGTDPVAFEADYDGDLGGVFFAEPESFGEVGFFVGGVPGFCLAIFDLEILLASEVNIEGWMIGRRWWWERVLYLFWVKVHLFAGHVLCQTEDLHLLADGGLDDFLEGVLSMARAELARVAVVGEWHCVCILFLSCD